MNAPSVYQQHGFANRREYLESLCEEYPRDAVFGLAGMLGPNEDFDGLVTVTDSIHFPIHPEPN